MAISGVKRKQVEFKENKKFIGLCEVKVIAVNPDEEQYVEITGNEVREGSKQFDYLSVDEDNNKQLRVDFWLQDVKNEENVFKTSYFLKNVVRLDKNKEKTEYINQFGNTAWSTSKNLLKDEFKKTDYREAHEGESDLYAFLKVWICNLDYRDADTVLDVEWVKLMKGNVKELRGLIDSEYSGNILVLLGIKSTEKEQEDGNVKIVTYQSVFKKAVYPYFLKKLTSKNYDDERIYGNVLTKRINKEKLESHEYFVADVKGEYGFKDVHSLKTYKEFVGEEHIATTNETISEDDTDY